MGDIKHSATPRAICMYDDIQVYIYIYDMYVSMSSDSYDELYTNIYIYISLYITMVTEHIL